MPKYTTVISAHGPDGNIFVILGRASSLLRQLGEPESVRSELTERVMATGSYKEALAIIREWFPVEGDDE